MTKPKKQRKTPVLEWIPPDHRHVGLVVRMWTFEDELHDYPLLAVLPERFEYRFIGDLGDGEWQEYDFAVVPGDPMKDAPRDRPILAYMGNQWVEATYIDGLWRAYNRNGNHAKFSGFEFNFLNQPVAWKEIRGEG